MPSDLPDLPDLPDIPAEAYITDPSQFEALTSGLRMRILKLCQTPHSVREVAEKLDMPVTRLYYHVNLLEAAGFLEVVHTRKSGARLEKIYRITGLTIKAGPDLIDNVDDTSAAAKAMTAIVIEPARAETEDALRNRFEGDDQTFSLGRTTALLTPAQIEQLEIQLRAIVDEAMAEEHDPGDDAQSYSFTYTLVPTNQEEKP